MIVLPPELCSAQSNRQSPSNSARPKIRSTWSGKVSAAAALRNWSIASGANSLLNRSPISIVRPAPRIVSRLVDRWATNQSELSASSAPKFWIRPSWWIGSRSQLLRLTSVECITLP
tara:strand:- start:1748 stop:2098 length:351 start_codon:yes stop_codon:yes gene_type:complete